jgi:hypothetical protein
LTDPVNLSGSFQGDWKFDNIKVVVGKPDGDVPYYDEYADLLLKDSSKVSFYRIKSITIRNINGKWKMIF